MEGFVFASYQPDENLNFVVRGLTGVDLSCGMGGWRRGHGGDPDRGGAHTSWGAGWDQIVAIIHSLNEEEEVGQKQLRASEQLQLEVEMGWLL